MTGNGTFKLGGWTVEPSLDRISRDGAEVHLQPQIMDLLEYLARNQGEVISAEELLENVWQGRIVTSSSIYSGLKQLRQALGDDVNHPRYIETIPKRGYRLITPVQFAEAELRGMTGQTRTRRFTIPVIFAILASFLAISWIYRSGPSTDPPALPAAAAVQPSLAVLPFTDLSRGEEYRWFGDGVAREILRRLGRVPGIRLSGETSSRIIRERARDPGDIGAELGVSHVLQGTVHRQDGRLQIEATLTRVRGATAVWTNSFEGSEQDTFAFLRDLSEQIAESLQLKLAGLQAGSGAHYATYRPRFTAYELYLQSLDLIDRNTKNDLMAAVDKLKKALDIEPEFADAHAALARTYYGLTWFDGYYTPGRGRDEANQLAVPHVEQALEIDPQHAEAHMLRSDRYLYAEPGRIEALKTALALNPSLVEAHTSMGTARNSYLVPWTEVVSYLDRAVEIDPLSVDAATLQVLFLAFVPHRWAEAERTLADLVRREPDSVDAKMSQAVWLLMPRGRPAEAAPLLEEILVTDPNHLWARSFLTKAWFMLGEYERASKMPWAVEHWRYVLSEERGDALRMLREKIAEQPDMPFGAKTPLAFALMMLRDWQGVVDLMNPERRQPETFSSIFAEDLVLNESPAMSLAVAFRALGDEVGYRSFAEIERSAINIRTSNGQLHNIEYSRGMARLMALEGNHYEALLELRKLVTEGWLDPRELIHPAYDDMRDDPAFVELGQLQTERLNRERALLDLPPLESGYAQVSPRVVNPSAGRF